MPIGVMTRPASSDFSGKTVRIGTLQTDLIESPDESTIVLSSSAGVSVTGGPISGDGSGLTNLPGGVRAGFGNLDSNGQLSLTLPVPGFVLVANIQDNATGGAMQITNDTSATWTITSNAGALDASKGVFWILAAVTA